MITTRYISEKMDARITDEIQIAKFPELTTSF